MNIIVKAANVFHMPDLVLMAPEKAYTLGGGLRLSAVLETHL